MIRPYYNALHDHWGNVGPVATASLPGFDLHSPAGLIGYDLTLALIGAGKWPDPMNNTHGGHGGAPVLSGLAANETIYIGFGGQPDFDTDDIDPNNPDSFRLADNIAGSVTDIDLEYSIFINPINTLYYLQWQLETDAPGIAASDPIYTILSPNPDVGGLHHASLALESHFGIVSAPEPSATLLLAIGTIGVLIRRRR